VFRTDNREVPSIQRRDDTEVQSFGKRDDGCIDGSQGQVAISSYELCDPYPIARENRHRGEVSRGEIPKESDFCCPAEASLDEIGNFGDDELRHQQWPRMGFKKLQACFMVVVVRIDVRVKRTGIDDQRDRRASCRMISSMWRAVSRRPLRPAFAAMRFRRALPPTCASIASRVMSAIVLPRRVASWRNFASRSSGSFTVVRLMVCQHTYINRATSTRCRFRWFGRSGLGVRSNVQKDWPNGSMARQ